MITVNQYFDGNIKSLGFQLDDVSYTTGVFLPGEYAITTEEEEQVTLTVGDFEIRLPGKDWKPVEKGETVVIARRSRFELRVMKPASYVCLYK
jgi:purine/pyrimidine-nucleoside phosphorylase